MFMVRMPLCSLLLIFAAFTPLAHADVLDDILERGTIRVAVAEFVPWTMKTGSGDLIGFEIDVAKKIADDMGVDVEFDVYAWEDIIPALESGDVDIIAGGMSITPGRALRINFTRPLAESGVGLATNTAMTRDIGSLEDLNADEIVITTVTNTTAASLCSTLFGEATLKEFATPDLAEKELLEGRAHAYLASVAEVGFLQLQHSDTVDLPLGEPLIASSEAIAVAKGEQELLNFLNAWVTARQSDRWLPTTREYWFSTMDWMPSAK